MYFNLESGFSVNLMMQRYPTLPDFEISRDMWGEIVIITKILGQKTNIWD